METQTSLLLAAGCGRSYKVRRSNKVMLGSEKAAHKQTMLSDWTLFTSALFGPTLEGFGCALTVTRCVANVLQWQHIHWLPL